MHEQLLIDELRAHLKTSGIETAIHSLRGAKATKAKYLDTNQWLMKAVRDAREVGLFSSRPLRILDIGTGPGYFPLVCRQLGHICVGLDSPTARFFATLRHCTRTETVEHQILPLTPLPAFGQRFDLVTTFRCPFNAVRAEARMFSISEWSFFLDDLRDNVLLPGGGLFMMMHEDAAYPGLNFDSDELRVFFASRGAQQERRVIRFFPLL